MSSMILSASPWSGNSTRKRTATINRKKTFKNNTSNENLDPDTDTDPESISENFQNSLNDQTKRNEKVNMLLNKVAMADASAGSGLADFTPVQETFGPKPQYTTNGIEGFAGNTMNAAAMDYGPNNMGEEQLSNYAKAYEHRESGLLGKPYYASMGNGSNNNNSSVLEKLNYMTRILEDMQVEKTANVGEEVVLYCFLGIFVVFVIDSFSKAGKYYR